MGSVNTQQTCSVYTMIRMYYHVCLVCTKTEESGNDLFQNTLPTFTFNGRLKLQNTCPKTPPPGSNSKWMPSAQKPSSHFDTSQGEDIISFPNRPKWLQGAFSFLFSANLGIFLLEYRGRILSTTTRFILVPRLILPGPIISFSWRVKYKFTSIPTEN
jgi:hypothetical protein